MINCHVPDGGRDRRTPRMRLVVVIVVFACGTTLRSTGLDPASVVTTLTALGLVGVATARMVIDGAGEHQFPALRGWDGAR